MKRLNKDFYLQESVELAKQLLGKTLVRKLDDYNMRKYKITATEAYYGGSEKIHYL